MNSARWRRSAALMLAVAAAGLLLMLVAAQRRRERCALGVTCLQSGVPVWAQRFDEASGDFAKAEDLGFDCRRVGGGRAPAVRRGE